MQRQTHKKYLIESRTPKKRRRYKFFKLFLQTCRRRDLQALLPEAWRSLLRKVNQAWDSSPLFPLRKMCATLWFPLGWGFKLDNWNENHFPTGVSKLFSTYVTTTTAITGATQPRQQQLKKQQQQQQCRTVKLGHQRWQRLPFYYYFFFCLLPFLSFFFRSSLARCVPLGVVEINQRTNQRSIQPTIKAFKRPTQQPTDLHVGGACNQLPVWHACKTISHTHTHTHSGNIAQNCCAFSVRFFLSPFEHFVIVFSFVLKLNKWLNIDAAAHCQLGNNHRCDAS